MGYIARALEGQVEAALRRGKSVLLLGARQTGKSTLAGRFSPVLSVNFIRPDLVRRYGGGPHRLVQEVAALPRLGGRLPLVLFDEVQRLPECLDVAQDAIDRGLAQFILTGSSMRQLRRHRKLNLLPGRVVALQLDPLTWLERPEADLARLLNDGGLPGMVGSADDQSLDADLNTYVATYLDQEIRQEAATRSLGNFSRFLELAALESGHVVNFSKMAQDIGIAHTTVKAYFEILYDGYLLERVAPLSDSPSRKKLTRSNKYLFFDLGVRRASANEGRQPSAEQRGHLLEQWVGLELCRQVRLRGRREAVAFWRDPDGPEVNWVVKAHDRFIPIEVKWTDLPSARDVRHLKTFLREYPQAPRGYLICRTPNRMRLAANIDALPWQALAEVWEGAGRT